MAEEADSQGAWLGLLKWSLAYVDGTVPTEDSPNYQAMSEEDKKFLEDVMKNGIIDEGDRMKTILRQLVLFLEETTEGSSSSKEIAVKSEAEATSSMEEIEELLLELQDIVEQIDFAKSFAAMGGIPFLIGCASRIHVPRSIRAACLSILGTMCQNNPSVQYTMLEQGNIPKLINIYFSDVIGNEGADGNDPLIRSRAMHAMSCCIRNHHVGEQIFCMNEQGRAMIENGLKMNSDTTALRRKALFFLQALVTSDSADASRVGLFTTAIQYVTTRYLGPKFKEEEENTDTVADNDDIIANPLDIRELALSMLNRILEQKKSVNALLDIQTNVVGTGVQRIHALRLLEDGSEEKEMAQEELRLWEELLTHLSRAVRDEVNPDTGASSAPMLGGRPEDDNGGTLAQ